MNKLPRYHILIRILWGNSYGAIDRSQKQNGGGHWFLYLHIDGVVLTVADAKINTGKIFFEKNANLSTCQINQLYSTLLAANRHGLFSSALKSIISE